MVELGVPLWKIGICQNCMVVRVIQDVYQPVERVWLSCGPRWIWVNHSDQAQWGLRNSGSEDHVTSALT